MAAIAINRVVLSLTASAAIAQHQPAQASGAPAVAAGNAIGFANTAAASGQLAPVAAGGTALAVAGAAISAGALVEVHTTVTQVVARAAGVPIGRALNAAAAAGDLIEVFLIPN